MPLPRGRSGDGVASSPSTDPSMTGSTITANIGAVSATCGWSTGLRRPPRDQDPRSALRPAHWFELRPLALRDERQPPLDHPTDRWQVEGGAMRRLVAPRLEHPDRVEVVAVVADHVQLAAVRTLQRPGCGDE